MRAWSLITLGDDRQYGGNTGYEDELQRVYKFDSNVANSKRIAKGDLVVLRDRSKALGSAVISHVDSYDGTKSLNRCPICNTTAIKSRQNKSPKWRCNKGHEFSDPASEEVTVTKYEAHFGDTFSTIYSEIDAQLIKAVALRPSDQLSMEELDLKQLEDLLAEDEQTVVKIRQALLSSDGKLDENDASDSADFDPTNMTDQRKLVERSINERRGQAKFRNALIKRYGAQCAVTGCDISQIIEAAHILPYRGEEYNHPSNGLLLRADIHTLFDLNMLWIEPSKFKVVLHPEALKGEYAALNGKRLAFAKGKPSIDSPNGAGTYATDN